MRTSIITLLQAKAIRVGNRIEKYPRHSFPSAADPSFPGKRATEYYQVRSIHAASGTLNLSLTNETIPLLSSAGAINRENISPLQVVADGYWWLS